MNWYKLFKKTWWFIWEDDSALSWIVNILLAFIIVKFLLYPAAGAIMGTSHPVVAVVSESMEHNPWNFDKWWESHETQYEEFNINKEQFKDSKLNHGFNKGDIIFLRGVKEIEVGDIIVFQGSTANPIIHRVVKIYTDNKTVYYQTKGDNNQRSYEDLQETKIPKEKIIGKATFKLPYLGWVKIIFVQVISLF